MKKPTFEICKNSQKGVEDFSSTFSKEILDDICHKLTNKTDYDLKFVDIGYNRGRLAKLILPDKIHYITISPTTAKSRNSWFQSVSTAFGDFYRDPKENKSLNYYIINLPKGINTPYHQFMYRLMITSGFNFLNGDNLEINPVKFNSIQDLILSKEKIRGNNSANNSSFVTISEDNITQVYAKTYGANKKESVLLCIAISFIQKSLLQLIQFEEGNLKSLPKVDLELISELITLNSEISDKQYEKNEFVQNNSLRSKAYIYNLLDKLGHKKCAMCECSIPQIIQGAHIWPVSEIKQSTYNDDVKLHHAINIDNGLWLCENHHKLFDSNILAINKSGEILRKKDTIKEHRDYIKETTKINQIDKSHITNNFIEYINLRNEKLNITDFINAIS
ncbi:MULTISPECIES: HNH endonuclease [unclassified Citrobacter]|uniref:HNH endonuclease n=1 Tax=unclassified Citrobacter TaxID=2644389 RepID=UPI0025752398|nr:MULTISPECIES: HNH endonuclease [unclassified Citrobacter]MDM2805800.1 HNH endonuclease [Citrobacter sp. Cpo107]MDM2806550.1 HNH endonuclease [Citrobacter sp. Cpo107]MDM2807753.1 HNH endonuclease [Citrobacter sp. Cpo107]MDM2807756.1 HNH endonuclease [Citrobacter sp. Cpo107]MDM3144712.1 HNH endonuclease [Citrobacter sp. Cf124]